MVGARSGEASTVDPRRQASSGERFVAMALLIAAGLVFVIAGWGRITGPLGFSHDGNNAAVWASGSRALREDGIVVSRLGAIHEDGFVYVSHPPLILVETAAFEAVAGEHEVVTRAAAWLSLLASIVLLYRLARDAAIAPVPAAAGVFIGLTTPMVLAYGAMLDTPMTSLAFGTAAAIAFQRAWQRRPLPPAATVALVALACLAGWQATLLVWLAASALVVRGAHQVRATRQRAPDESDGPALDTAWPLLIGAVLGTGLTVGWAWWATGEVRVLLDQFTRRSSDGEGITRGTALSNQYHFLARLLGPAVLGMLGAVGALWDRRRRPIAALLLVVTLVYPVALYNGAGVHDYWNYWWVLPVAFGWGFALDGASVWLRARSSATVTSGFAVVVAVLLTVVAGSSLNVSAELINNGEELGRALLDRRDGADPVVAAEIGLAAPPDWMDHLAGYDLRTTEVRSITSRAELADLASTHPGAVVASTSVCPGDDTGVLCRELRPTLFPGDDPPLFRADRAECLAVLVDGQAASRPQTGC